MKKNFASEGLSVEISELKSEAEMDEYDRIIIEANKKSETKFVRSIELENKTPVADFKAFVDKTVQESIELEEYIQYRELMEQLTYGDYVIEIPISTYATKTITKVDWNNSCLKIRASCSGSSTTTISVNSATGLSNNVFWGVHGSGQTWSYKRLDAGRTAGVTVKADVVDAGGRSYRATMYAEFSRSAF